MPRPLYLDTARIGQFATTAMESHESFIDLVSDAPTEPTLLPFLRDGASAWRDPSQLDDSLLSNWRGIQDLEYAFANRLGASVGSRVFIASRTSSLIRLGLQLLYKRCRRCLTVDICWPNYLRELHHHIAKDQNGLFVKSLRRAVYDEKLEIPEICERICHIYRDQRCDGLFLPVVDHLGSRIPVAEIVKTLRSSNCEVRFVLLDAAQAFAHVPMAEDIKCADLVIHGTHKWLGSYFPLGVAVAPKPSNRDAIAKDVAVALKQTFIDDGLLKFLENLKSNGSAQTETINLSPLFSAFGAISDSVFPTDQYLRQRIQNADLVSDLAENVGWSTVRPAPSIRTGILLLRPPLGTEQTPAGTVIQRCFAKHAIYLTAYDSGLIRLSMPSNPMSQDSFDRLHRAFSEVQAWSATGSQFVVN